MTMINCPACGGPTKPLFSSFYCVKECDLRKSRAIMADSSSGPLVRFDGRTCLYITNPAMVPASVYEYIWVDRPGALTAWPKSPQEAAACTAKGAIVGMGWHSGLDGMTLAKSLASNLLGPSVAGLLVVPGP